MEKMVVAGNGQYGWAQEIKEFDETKAGVKGLADAGVVKLPSFFVHPPESFGPLSDSPQFNHASDSPLELPTIDFRGVEAQGERRKEIVSKIREAAENWGFFRIVNHGVPLEVMDSMLDAVRQFHEQPKEAKIHLYSSDSRQRVRFSSNGALRENEYACWRDLLTCVFHDDTLDPEAIPSVCRKAALEYVKYMIQMRETMAEILSEALGLSSDHLSSIECMKSESLACLYYPACPEPEKTLGTVKHSDTTFLTLLTQDSLGGLQILHDNLWLDVPPVRGAIIANVGDLMQIISNDRFKSVEHRVLAQAKGPRISVACFFTPSGRAGVKPFGPIKELLSEKNPAIYKEFLCTEYYEYYKTKAQDVTSALPRYRIR